MSTDEQVERLEKATAEARDVLGQLYSAGKDLRNILREARTFSEGTVREQLDAEVKTQVAALSKVTTEQIDVAVKKIVGEFEKLATLFLGLDSPASLEELIKRRREAERVMDGADLNRLAVQLGIGEDPFGIIPKPQLPFRKGMETK